MSMKKFLAALLVAPSLAFAVEDVKLDRAEVDVTDLISLQSGARTFVNYCLNCHSASFVRYNTLTQLGLTEQQIKDNLMFTAEKVGEPMNVAITKKEAKEWFGVVPPDLSVIARSRGADWLYTYLRGFYRDPAAATGWNNTVFPNVGMPHVLWTLQGQRVKIEEPVMKDGKPALDGHGLPLKTVKWETVVPGTQTPAQYDQTVNDLVNFLVWIGEPQQLYRKQLGIWVVFALVVLIALTYVLKQSFWKDLH